jgi:hypothetical protein
MWREIMEETSQAVLQFVNAETWTEGKRIVEEQQHLLLTDAADGIFEHILQQSQDNEQAVRTLWTHRLLLRRCREIGIEPAFKELTGGEVPERLRELEQQASAADKHYKQTYDLSDLRATVAAWSHLLNHSDFASADETFRARILNNSGITYQNLYERSGEGLERAIAVKEEAVALTPQGHPDRPSRLNNLGNAYQRAYERSGEDGQLQRAIEHYEKAVALTPKGHPDRPSYLNNLGNAYQSAYERSGEDGQLQRAIAVLEDAVALTPKGHPNRPGYLNNLGNAYQSAYERSGEHDDLRKAIATYQAALDGYAAGVFPMDRRRTGNNLGRLLYRVGRYGEARKAFEQAHHAIEQLHDQELSEQDRRKLSQDNALLYAHLVSCCLIEGDTAAALEYAAAGKGRAFVDMLASARFDLNEALQGTLEEDYPGLKRDVEEVQRLQQKIDRLLTTFYSEARETDGQRQTLDEQQRDAIARQVVQRQGERQQKWAEMARKYPVLTATQRAPSLKAADARALAAALDATLVEYYRHHEGWGAFVVTAEGVRWVRLAGLTKELLEELTTWVDDIENPVQQGLISDYNLDLLYKAAVAPLGLPAGGRVVLAPYGPLHRLPLGAARPEEGRYVSEQYEVSFAMSIAALQTARQQEQVSSEAAGEWLLGAAYPGQPQEKNYLRHVVPEVEAVVRYFAPKAEEFTNDEATPEIVIQHAAGKKIVHVGCHGHFDEEEPADSGLALAGGQLTIPRIITEMKLRQTRLLTMGACVSGRSQVARGDELVGLTQAILTAGARAVVASLWHVHDASTRALFEAFYRYLQESGYRPTLALQQAQAEVRKRKGWEHPYYWGAFQVSGLGYEWETAGKTQAAGEISAKVDEVHQEQQPIQRGYMMSDKELIEKHVNDVISLLTQTATLHSRLHITNDNRQQALQQLAAVEPTLANPVDEETLIEVSQQIWDILDGCGITAALGVPEAARSKETNTPRKWNDEEIKKRVEERERRPDWVEAKRAAIGNHVVNVKTELERALKDNQGSRQ